MQKFVGVLLIISLVSKPYIIKINFIALDIIKKANIKIISTLRKENEEKLVQEQDFPQIDLVMDKLNQNKRQLSALLKQKNEVVNKIETKMDLKAYSKTALSSEQIRVFNEFTSYYDYEGGRLKEILKSLEVNKQLNLIQQHLLHKETDYEFVKKELNSLNDKQMDAIYCLDNIIKLGNEALNIL